MTVFPVVILFLVKIALIQSNTNFLVNLTETKNNFFSKINAELHTVINSIFHDLKLMKYVTKINNFDTLLTMHNALLNIAERNFKVYDNLKNVSKVNFTAYENKYLEGFEDIVKEYNKAVQVGNKTGISNETVNESIEFLYEFLNKFNDVTAEHLINPIFNDTNETKNLIRSTKLQLKAWKSTPETSANNNSRRLFHGKATKIKEYPFLVSVHILSEFICAGSIISKDLIITAASCFQKAYYNREKPRSVFVRIGSDYTNQLGKLMPVTEVHIHPQYDSSTLQNNLAILRIMNKLLLSNKKERIRRIEIEREVQKPGKGGVFILGWGAEDERNEVYRLDKVSLDYLDVYDLEACKDIYTSNFVTIKNFCAGFVNRGGACKRDIGGPGIKDGQLVGVVSFGPTFCGTANSPTVFTKLAHYYDWIYSIINQDPVAQTQEDIFSTTPTSFRPAMFRTPSTKSTTTEDYPEEVLILKEILQKVVLSNGSIVDYILFGSGETNPPDIADPLATNKGEYNYLNIPTTKKPNNIIFIDTDFDEHFDIIDTERKTANVRYKPIYNHNVTIRAKTNYKNSGPVKTTLMNKLENEKLNFAADSDEETSISDKYEETRYNKRQTRPLWDFLF